MTRNEKIILLRDKAASLVKWFEDHKLTFDDIWIAEHKRITDVNFFIKAQIKRFEGYNADPFCTVYVCAYYELLQLKEYAEKHNLYTPTSGPVN